MIKETEGDNPMGKTLLELQYEIDELHKSVGTDTGGGGAICWQDNGLLMSFDEMYGHPGYSFSEGVKGFDNRDDFTSIGRFLSCIQAHHYDPIFDAPVWCVIDE